MPELIERDALKNHLYRAQAEAFKRSEWYVAGSIQSFIDLLDKQPTIEAKPVRFGRWKRKNGEIYCTNCKKSKWSESFELMLRGFDFCPKCGAKMDGGADNG